MVQRSPSANTDARRKLQPAYDDLRRKYEHPTQTEVLPMPLPELLDRLLAYQLDPPDRKRDRHGCNSRSI